MKKSKECGNEEEYLYFNLPSSPAFPSSEDPCIIFQYISLQNFGMMLKRKN